MKNDALRQRGIGGSEVAALFGLHPYLTPMSLYLQKTGNGGQRTEDVQLRLGRIFEPAILQAYAEKRGVQLMGCSTIEHPSNPWMVGSADALIPSLGIGVDAKHVHPSKRWEWGEEGSDQVPDYISLQCQQYMEIHDAPIWDVAATFGYDVEIFVVKRDTEIGLMLHEEINRFMTDHVLKRVPPPLDGHRSTQQWLKKKYATHGEQILEATPADTAFAYLVKDMEHVQKDLSLRLEAMKNKFREQIGENAGIKGEDWQVTWRKTGPVNVINWEALARAKGVTPEEIAAHTTQREGHRRLFFRWKEKSRD